MINDHRKTQGFGSDLEDKFALSKSLVSFHMLWGCGWGVVVTTPLECAGGVFTCPVGSLVCFHNSVEHSTIILKLTLAIQLSGVSVLPKVRELVSGRGGVGPWHPIPQTKCHLAA